MDNKRETMLREEKIGKLLLKLSLPAIIGMMFGALYNVVDTIFVGKGVDAFAIGGLTVAFPIQMFIVALAMLIGVGAQANISIYFGKKDIKRANEIAGSAYTMMFILAAILTALGYVFIVPLVKLFGASPTLIPYAKDYMSIIFMGTIVNSLTMVNNSILRSEGNAKISMIVMVVGTALNIVLDPIFIFALDMGIKGAAAATVISQYTSFFIGFFYMLYGNSIIKISFRSLKLKAEYLGEILKLGFPTFIRQVAGSIVAIFMNNSIQLYGGDIALSAFGVINRVMMFLLLPMFGIVQGVQPIIGFNYGAKNRERVKESVIMAIKIMMMYCVTALVLVMLFNMQLFKIFTDDFDVAAIGSKAIKIIFIGIPIIALQIIASSFFQSIGKSRPALVVALMRQVILLLPLILILPRLFGLGLTGIWISIPISDILSSLISLILLRRAFLKLE